MLQGLERKIIISNGCGEIGPNSGLVLKNWYPTAKVPQLHAALEMPLVEGATSSKAFGIV